jgi:hypothetical protein
MLGEEREMIKENKNKAWPCFFSLAFDENGGERGYATSTTVRLSEEGEPVCSDAVQRCLFGSM